MADTATALTMLFSFLAFQFSFGFKLGEGGNSFDVPTGGGLGPPSLSSSSFGRHLQVPFVLHLFGNVIGLHFDILCLLNQHLLFII